MNTIPCRGCRDESDPNCIESCRSYDVWAKIHYKKTLENMRNVKRRIKKEKASFEDNVQPGRIIYEPCDETGRPYKKGDLDSKFGNYGGE